MRKALAPLLAGLALLAGCTQDDPRSKLSDAELGLTPSQARGRRVYDAACARCHFAYRSGDLHGPTIKGLYGKPSMPSGVPANDERVKEVIVRGKRMMPPTDLSPQQLEDLVAYMRSL